tara:strand:- start:8515 stop:10701 length:2187 start_codon:yes stop_codon:yes gene_type:complete
MSTLSLTQNEIESLKSLTDSELQLVLTTLSQDPQGPTTRGSRKADREALRSAQDTRRHQDIGEPAWHLIDHDRRKKASESLAFHLKSYHPETFTLPFADFHYRFIDIAEHVVKDGGWFAYAVSRGFGKSKLSEGIVEWVLLHGFKRWPVLIGATSDAGLARMKNIHLQLRQNKKLLQDFPEVCHPFVSLGPSARKAEGQHIGGRLTSIELKRDSFVLPTVSTPHGWPYRKVSGSRVSAFGITGAFRGLSSTTVELETLRPDLGVADDPSTSESSRSYSQNLQRLSILKGDVGYLGGPGAPFALLVPCTVIHRDDLADQILNREVNPEFHGERHKMLESMPTNESLWDRYAEIRRDCIRRDVPTTEATDFYRDNRDAMDEGAKASWPARYDENELSAIQHAMNRKLRDEASFSAECQNEPATETSSEVLVASPPEIIVKQNHCERGVAPDFTSKIAAHIDVQQKCLYYAIVGSSMEFECAVLDYGTFPDQNRTHFRYRDSIKSFADVYGSQENMDSLLYRGIQDLIALIATTVIKREDGVDLKVDEILVDCGWEETPVISACRESVHRSIVNVLKGISVKAKDQRMRQRKRKPGFRLGHEWQEGPKPNMPSQKWINHNTNYWKSKLHVGLKTATGAGSVSLFKTLPERHRMIADHCNSEMVTRVTADGNTVDEWDPLPGKPDNHFFDNLVGALVGLSRQGCAVPGAHDNDRVPQGRRARQIKRGKGRFR